MAYLAGENGLKLLSDFRGRLDKLPAEASFDTKMAVGYIFVERRGDFHNLLILDVERDRAAHTAIGADGVGAGLLRLIPGSRLPHFIFAYEHQRAGRADANTVAAVDAGRIRQRRGIFGRDARFKPAPRHGDSESILRVYAAGLNALVAENTLGVVAQIQFIVPLGGLSDRGCSRTVCGGVVAGAGHVTRFGGRSLRAVAFGRG